jgi:glycosyltransferase involved in cell wall biosynthesis
MKPLVSVLIAAYNAEKTIGYTLQSAVGQTWQNMEVIVVDDGSNDRTPDVARQFKGVTVVSTRNNGLSVAQNHAFDLCHGDYLQYLDADDILAPDKIEKQLASLREINNPRIVASSPWAPFFHRTRNAHFVKNSLWQDLSPVEWLLRKMNEGIHMQNATWLVSREVAQAAGPWDTTLHYDQDGEFFSRILLASEGTRFVPGTGIYYRASGMNSISFVGNSNKKKDSLLLSMKLHMKYLRSLEDSERVRKACLAYMQIWFEFFYPDRPDIVEELQGIAAQLGGHLEEPRLRWKFACLQKFVGYKKARNAQFYFPQAKASMLRFLDKIVFSLEEAGRHGNG